MLSPYGTRRMFYALRQTVTSKNPAQAGMKDWPTPQSHPPPPAPLTMSQQLPTPTPAHPPPSHQGRMMSNTAPIAQQGTRNFRAPGAHVWDTYLTIVKVKINHA